MRLQFPPRSLAGCDHGSFELSSLVIVRHNDSATGFIGITDAALAGFLLHLIFAWSGFVPLRLNSGKGNKRTEWARTLAKILVERKLYAAGFKILNL